MRTRLPHAITMSSLLLALGLGMSRGGPAGGGGASAPRNDAAQPALFAPADACVACHNGLVTPTGEDVSIGTNWSASMMANSSRDPYWHAAVRREIMDFPEEEEEIERECVRCHMPMMDVEARAGGRPSEIFAHLPITAAGTRDAILAADGVSCTVCHQIQANGLGTEASFTGGFVVDTDRPWGTREVFGPFPVDSGRVTLMHSMSGYRPREAAHVQQSELCATCHTLFTRPRGPGGEELTEFPEQVPYLEWRHSDFPGEQSCQSCHMPVVEGSMRVASILGEPRSGFSRHDFRGANFFMIRMLNRYRAELGVAALPADMDAAARGTVEHLRSGSASITVEDVARSGSRLEATVVVTNQAGHKLPTAYPSRRVWIHLTVRDPDGRVVFESGALDPNGSIRGNDNDADAVRYEPHHREITSAAQVQVYEGIMEDHAGAVTTGLLSGVRFVKDNRILPRGFDKATADEHIAVQGAAFGDSDFAGGEDRVRYSVDVGDARGPFSVDAELWYQPISFRWASNLRHYDAPETDRFVGYYQSMADVSAVMLARATSTR